MMPDSPEHPPLRQPHPLALALIEDMRRAVGARVLEIGRGSGRNTHALARARFEVTSTGGYGDLPQNQRFAAALSTHALLHGRPAEIADALVRIAALLDAGAPLFATFGSTRDARFGVGEQIAPATFAPADGDERGVPHAYFDASDLRRMLERSFTVERLEERCVDDIAGTWAHLNAPLSGAWHWFTVARRPRENPPR